MPNPGVILPATDRIILVKGAPQPAPIGTAGVGAIAKPNGGTALVMSAEGGGNIELGGFGTVASFNDSDPMVIEQARISALGFGINYWNGIKDPATTLPQTAASPPAAMTTGAWVTDGGGRLSTGATIDFLAGPIFTKLRTRGGAMIFDGFLASPVTGRTAEFGLINAANSQTVTIMTDFSVPAGGTTNYLIKGLGSVTTSAVATGVLGVADASRHTFSIYIDPNNRNKFFGAIDGNEIMSYPLDTSILDQTYLPIMFSVTAADAALARWSAGFCL